MSRTEKHSHALEAEVKRLTAQLDELRAQFDAFRRTQHSNGSDGEPKSRRDVLKLAGVAAVGAAGALVLRETSAEATSGNPAILGATNDSSLTTNFVPTPGATPTPAPLMQAVGQGVTPPEVPATNGTQSIPVFGAIGPNGSLPGIGDPPVPDYPGFAPIQGVGGITEINTSTGATQVSEGLNGYGFGSTGIGVTGESDIGYGVIGGSGGIDLAALGNGRILQAQLLNSMMSNPPSGPPNFVPNDFEQIRDGLGVFWVSQPAPTGSPASAYWRRLNSVIPITPVRIVDTRIAVGGIQGPLAADQTYTWGPVPGSTIIGGSDNGKPTGIDAHAIGIVGNVTVTNFPNQGFVAVFPAGAPYDPNKSPSTLNFAPVTSAWANAFTTLLGTGSNAGDFSVHTGHTTTDVVVDVVGYLI